LKLFILLQGIDCGGGYIKVLPPSTVPEELNGDTPYNVMFGPDICGSDRKVHVILSYKGENKLIKLHIYPPRDDLTHLYTLILRPDQTYEVKIDDKTEGSGSILDDWDLLPPKKIRDLKAKKPEDWDERKMIPDPEDKKPEDWDSVSEPELIPDPDAKIPEDWEEEMDGEWIASMIQNPNYKGEWKQRQIPNPAYKGEWEPPEIDNPEYEADPKHMCTNLDL